MVVVVAVVDVGVVGAVVVLVVVLVHSQQRSNLVEKLVDVCFAVVVVVGCVVVPIA